MGGKEAGGIGSEGEESSGGCGQKGGESDSPDGGKCLCCGDDGGSDVSDGICNGYFGVAKSAMQQVYTDVAGLATVGAVVCAAVCLFLMNFSKSGKTVDESRAWLKRIIICWAALMTLGAIVTYMEKIIPQSSFTP